MTFIANFLLHFYTRKSGDTQMPKNPRVRKLMDGQHNKRSERLLKSSRQYLCIIFDHSEGKAAPEILRLFVNLLTPDEKYSLSVKAGV